MSDMGAQRRRQFLLVGGSGLAAAAAVVAVVIAVNVAGPSTATSNVVPAGSPISSAPRSASGSASPAASPPAVSPAASPPAVSPVASLPAGSSSAAVAPSSALSSAPAPGITRQVLFDPYATGRVPANITIVGTDVGTGCFRLGVKVYRCFGTYIFNDCFASPDGHSCVTLGSPWDTRATKVSVAVLPTDSFVRLKSEPFAIELSDGRRCINLLYGTGNWVGGLRLDYQCSATGSLFPELCGLGTLTSDCLYGEADTTGPLWTIKIGNSPPCTATPAQPCLAGSPDAKITGTVTIKTAWSW